MLLCMVLNMCVLTGVVATGEAEEVGAGTRKSCYFAGFELKCGRELMPWAKFKN